MARFRIDHGNGKFEEFDNLEAARIKAKHHAKNEGPTVIEEEKDGKWVTVEGRH